MGMSLYVLIDARLTGGELPVLRDEPEPLSEEPLS